MPHDGPARFIAKAPNVYDAEPIPEGAHAAIDRLLARPLPRKAGTARLILGLGATQILWLEMPAHAVIDTAVQRLELSRKHADEAYTLAERFESNPRSVWGYVQGLTRLSQRTPWQDGRFNLDRAASRLLTTVH